MQSAPTPYFTIVEGIVTKVPCLVILVITDPAAGLRVGTVVTSLLARSLVITRYADTIGPVVTAFRARNGISCGDHGW
jgi:hypothetical protein